MQPIWSCNVDADSEAYYLQTASHITKRKSIEFTISWIVVQSCRTMVCWLWTRTVNAHLSWKCTRIYGKNSEPDLNKMHGWMPSHVVRTRSNTPLTMLAIRTPAEKKKCSRNIQDGVYEKNSGGARNGRASEQGFCLRLRHAKRIQVAWSQCNTHFDHTTSLPKALNTINEHGSRAPITGREMPWAWASCESFKCTSKTTSKKIIAFNLGNPWPAEKQTCR